ncbi:ATP-binding protein [Haladaptatus pallidirubidus]|uniref:Histidine kinase domain-containing protein n=1 Tax=Haladaptatus pallidirubidus TaxID=1008152 RepID=A0AAV3UM04_9EURY|nr:GAF domain-containing sensor histidine kinase [Haladaptatus pallidirubidus]
MDAEQGEEIARIAVETAEEVLDHPYSAVVFPDDDGTELRAVAVTDALADGTDAEMVFRPSDSAVWDVFESGESAIYEPSSILSSAWYRHFPIWHALLFPLGKHGVLGIGYDVEKRAFTDHDRRFAQILATTTEAALNRAQRETELRESQAMVEERTDQIEFFNGVLRHDILNGITAISGNLELLDEHVPESGRSHLETVQQWSEDIGQLTQKVRSASQMVTNAESMPLGSHPLSDTLSHKVTKIRNTYPNVSVEASVEDGLCVSGNELLGEVLENVLLNAIEHNDRSFPSLAVRAQRDEDVVRVEIEDDGPGIPDEMKSEVFDRNVTSESSGSVGFGLYFVHMMMTQYGGNIRFEDAENRGAVAVLTFSSATNVSLT